MDMTQEEKQLLLKDLCARFPYGVMCRLSVKGVDVSITEKLETGGLEHFIYGTMEVKPYLRPMSSMTEEEEGMYNLLQGISHLAEQHWTAKDGKVYRYADAIDWLNEHHFDYRGLIPMGLALEAPEGMYKTE